MKKQTLGLLIATLAAQIIAGACGAQEQADSQFKLEIISEWHVGSSPGFRPLIVRETNISGGEIRDPGCVKEGGDINISVVFDGLPMQEKEAVQQHRKLGDYNRCVGGRMPLRLEPGAHRDSLVYVNKFYDLSKPGAYEVTASKETNPNQPEKSVTVKSNTYTIVVTTAESKAAEKALAEKRSLGPLTIKAEELTVHAGEPIIVDVTRKNMSDNILFLRNVQNLISWADFDVLMDSQPAPQTELLRQAKTPGAVFVDTGQTISLTPGETAESNADLNDFFDMSEPGTYHVTASLVCLQCEASHVVKSNTITITVLPADSLPPANK